MGQYGILWLVEPDKLLERAGSSVDETHVKYNLDVCSRGYTTLLWQWL